MSLCRKLIIYLFVSLLFLTSISSTSYAAGLPIPRPDRPGELYLALDSDISSQYKAGDIVPIFNTFNIIQLIDRPTSYIQFVLDNGDVWELTDNNNVHQILGLSNIKQMDSVNRTYFAVKNDGTVWSWGCDSYIHILGRDPDAPNTCDNLPTQINGLDNASKIVATETHVMVLKSDGTVWGWGSNLSGELGLDPNVSTTSPGNFILYPTQISLPSSATSITASGTHSMALLSSGLVYEWGWLSSYPQNIWPLNPTPTMVPNLSNVSFILNDNRAAFVVKADGTVWSWGSSFEKQIPTNVALPVDGDGTYYAPTPIQLSGIPLMSELQANDYSSIIGRSTNDDLWIWGNNLPQPLNIPNTQGVGAYSYNNSQVLFVRPTGPILNSITSLPSSVTINRGEQQQLSVIAHYSDSSTQDITNNATYSSDNPYIVSIYSGGKLTGVAPGTTNVTISYYGKSISIPVTVNPTVPQPPTNLTLVNGSQRGQLSLSWSPPADDGGSAILSYQIFRRTGTNPFSKIAETTSTNYLDTGLTTGIVYDYYVVAASSVGLSNQSIIASKAAPGLFGDPRCLRRICI